MKNMLRLALILSAYAVVACVGLAFVHLATAPRIEAAAREEVNASLRVVLPQASDFEDALPGMRGFLSASPDAYGSSRVSIDRAYVAKKGGSVIGMVVQATGPTYKSSTILVAVGMDRRIHGVKFLSSSDTPGIGSKAAQSPFLDQFASKGADDAFAVKADVQAISGATISSRGVAAILKAASRAACDYLAAKAGGPGPGKTAEATAPSDGASGVDAVSQASESNAPAPASEPAAQASPAAQTGATPAPADSVDATSGASESTGDTQ